ncbi:hypothetical protein PR202_ga26871 [Eleusine coracana subsp. coracana]|uniref:Uncharacterized protein n=1 Tax=Eleusine coracana subsp. coracana TaxID=191504 RepID=A0AAV5DEU4_ELECO|nr:hypothetical protein PR202_ga26871 [Eleusine coracana subsp. coracana]
MERWGSKGGVGPEPRARRYADQPSFSSTLLDAIYKSMDEPTDAAAETMMAAKTKKRGGGIAALQLPLQGVAGRELPRQQQEGHPASPGARLAGFLNSIFAGGGHKQRTPPPSSSRGAAESACSTASSSYSRSCLSKTPSTRGQPRRTVRFLDADVDATAERRNRMQQVGVVHLEQMLLRRMEMESDDDDDDEDSSDASSDLFELENLSAVAPAAGAAYRDELPVYETTRVRSIGHGYAHGRSTAAVV